MLKLSEEVCVRWALKLRQFGEEQLYQKILLESLASSSTKPELDLLDLSEEFFKVFRRSGEDCFFIIAKLLRRAAHVIYRQRLKTQQTSVNHKRFLNYVGR